MADIRTRHLLITSHKSYRFRYEVIQTDVITMKLIAEENEIYGTTADNLG